MLIATTVLSMGTTAENVFAYSNNQASTGTNACGNGERPDLGVPVAAPNHWQVLLINPGPNPVTIQAFAECAKLVDAP